MVQALQQASVELSFGCPSAELASAIPASISVYLPQCGVLAAAAAAAATATNRIMSVSNS